MIELKNITLRVFKSDKSINELIKQTGASSVEDLLMLRPIYPEYNWFEVIKKVQEIEKEMSKANRKGHEPIVFYTKGYNNKILIHQDSLNDGNILLTNNPTDYVVRYFSLKNKSINQIKNDLSHTYPNGENCVLSASYYYRNIGAKTIPRLVSLIEMYEEQIERQAILTTRRDINLFEMDKEEKRHIVENVYKDIIEYLITNAKESFVWGNLSERQKQLYLYTLTRQSEESERTRKIITEYISNYTTLPELYEVKNNNLKVLKRFIVK